MSSRNPEDAPYPVIDRQYVIRAPTVREWSKPEATLPDGRGSVSSVRNQAQEQNAKTHSSAAGCSRASRSGQQAAIAATAQKDRSTKLIHVDARCSRAKGSSRMPS